MVKKAFLLLLCMMISICSSACGTVDITTFQMSVSKSNVTEFLDQSENLPETYDNDQCCNITPQEITDQYGFEIFKFDQSCAGYLMYKDQIYPLGEWFGGYGIVAFAVADINRDKSEELYFTCSSGSGVHRSQAGYFDSAAQKVVMFDYSNPDNDMVFVSENNRLTLYNAQLKVPTFVEISATPKDKVGEIALDSGTITLTPVNK